MLAEFKNEKLLDFQDEKAADRFRAALASVEASLGKNYPLLIGGERIETEKKIVSVNPSMPEQIVGYVSEATPDLAQRAIAAAEKAFPAWAALTAEERARYLFKAAAIMRRRRDELSAWMVYEAGKNWAEADADTCEAIDFLEFYGREMYRLGGPQPLTRLEGEDNELYYFPLGVGAIISPWNFPLAITTGMTSAAIVAGNPVVLKPASTTPVIASKFVDIMLEAGVPAGVINYLPGSGGVIGDCIVTDPRVRFINFTGSKEVGLRINELAAKVSPGQKFIKRVVAEMGGKDAIVVDAGTDLDEAAGVIVTSAFGFQGQKCSACSRVIAHAEIYDALLALVIDKTKALTLGSPKDNCNVGPVIDGNALRKIKGYIETGRKEGKVVLGGETREDLGGFYLEPTIIADVSSGAVIAQEEIFGPVLAFIKATDFSHALAIANDTDYGLTGSVFSNNRSHLEKARVAFSVGNLYFNRKCTGAMVGAHPFGGFNMSGTDSKAGGKDYLLLFTQAKAVSEKF